MIFLFRSTGFVCGSTISGAIVQVSFKKLLTERIQGPEAQQVCKSAIQHVIC